jgi:hypothetical protein
MCRRLFKRSASTAEIIPRRMIASVDLREIGTELPWRVSRNVSGTRWEKLRRTTEILIQNYLIPSAYKSDVLLLQATSLVIVMNVMKSKLINIITFLSNGQHFEPTMAV